MTLKCLKPTLAVLAAAAVGVPLSGCSTNDNPINPDKMNQIRQQESRDRANFKPMCRLQTASSLFICR